MFGLSAAATGKTRRRLPALRAALALPWFRFHPIALMNENKGVFGVNLGHLWDESERVAGWMSALLDGVREGAIRPVIAARFPFEEAAQAHHYLQDRKNVGKVLLIP
jgi:NADPH:quinone reductase-like Zn-dependent oxidoreductase